MILDTILGLVGLGVFAGLCVFLAIRTVQRNWSKRKFRLMQRHLETIVICPKCGEKTSENFRFCGMCGAVLEVRRPAGAPAPNLSSITSPGITNAPGPLSPIVAEDVSSRPKNLVPPIGGPSMLGLGQQDPNQSLTDHGNQKITAVLDASPSIVYADPGITYATRRLALLYELPLRLAQEGHIDTLLQAIVEQVVAIIPGAARGALLVKDRTTGNLILKAHQPLGTPVVSMTLALRALEQHQAFIWLCDGDIVISRDDITTGMYAPLLWKGDGLGVICVDNNNGSLPFDSDDLRLMVAVANYAAMAVASQHLQQELRTNATLLERLLTSFSPSIRRKLLEKARHGRLHPGGEKSEVTVLISDIRGFTRMSAVMEAEDVLDMLNEYFPALADAVFRNDGTIDKFMGDAILAVFGSPEPDPQHFEKALRTGIAMQEAIVELNRARSARKQLTCNLGIGIHCGQVLHGFVGSVDRMEFTVIGDAVNLASRYCSAARPGDVVISPELYQRVWRLAQVEKVTVPTKHEGDLSAYRVVGLTTRQTS
jgi:adenylate cyclase